MTSSPACFSAASVATRRGRQMGGGEEVVISGDEEAKRGCEEELRPLTPFGPGYESTIERGLYKALHELQRLQPARSGQVVPPSMAADVEIALLVGGETSGDSAKQSQ